ncbi:MAG: ATP-binding protein [Byssovorax sp.]
MSRPSVPSAEPRWRVVIIDDSAEDRADVRRLLLQGSSRRYELIEAKTAEIGIRAILDLTSGPPDCVILDFHLPDADALEILADLRRIDGDGVCPVVVLTGAGDHAIGKAVLRAGAQDYAGKAWMTAESLSRTVENAVERWSMAVELRVTNTRLRLALEASKTGIWTRNLKSDAMTWSPECHALFGISERDFDGTFDGVLDSVHPDDRTRVVAAAQVAIDAHQPYRAEFRVVRAGGEVVWVLSQGRATYDRGGRPVRKMGTYTDITERKRNEALVEAGKVELQAALDQARSAVSTRDELISLVSHDLKNPLNTMGLGIALLEEEVGAEGREVLKKMERQVLRMNKLIDELIDAALLHAGMPIGLSLKQTDLVALTRAAVEQYSEVTADHVLSLRVATEPLVGTWDPKRIVRVIDNLLSNAVKYSPDGGQVQVELEQIREGATTWALLRVTDEGIGISASDLGRVFQWYSRGDNALRTSIPGTGIGLAGIRDIVTQHGGSVSVESQEGRGSTFTVKLPTEPPSVPVRSSRP